MEISITIGNGSNDSRENGAVLCVWAYRTRSAFLCGAGSLAHEGSLFFCPANLTLVAGGARCDTQGGEGPAVRREMCIRDREPAASRADSGGQDRGR